MAKIPEQIVEQVQQNLDKHQVRQHFSCHASEYDRYAHVQQRVVRRLVELIIESSTGLQRGLEVGSGTGILGSRFCQAFPAAELVLSDIAHGMSCQSHKALPGCLVCDADAAALPFAEQSFDFLISSSVYQWVEGLSGAFNEAARVLQVGGLFGIALFGKRTLYELREAHQFALAGGESHGQNFPSQSCIEQALGDRFTIENLFSEDEVEWHADVPQLLRNLKRIGAQNSSTRKPQGLASRRVMQAMFECYRNNFGSQKGIPATYQVIYLLARKKP